MLWIELRIIILALWLMYYTYVYLHITQCSIFRLTLSSFSRLSPTISFFTQARKGNITHTQLLVYSKNWLSPLPLVRYQHRHDPGITTRAPTPPPTHACPHPSESSGPCSLHLCRIDPNTMVRAWRVCKDYVPVLIYIKQYYKYPLDYISISLPRALPLILKIAEAHTDYIFPSKNREGPPQISIDLGKCSQPTVGASVTRRAWRPVNLELFVGHHNLNMTDGSKSHPIWVKKVSFGYNRV